jgi:predicted  nucleic acid-binding Zn-ribbon protein
MKFREYISEERTVTCSNCGNTFKSKKPKEIARKCYKCGNNIEWKEKKADKEKE